MADLAGFFDDSGTHGDSRFVVVAGGVASLRQWDRLSKEWERTIGPWKLSRGYFHMADFVSGYNDYHGWTPLEKCYRLRALVRIICEHVRVLVGNAVVQGDFNAALEICPSSVIGTAYRFCAFLALPAVDHWRRRSPRRNPVALIFERGNKLKNEYGQLLTQLGDFDRTREKYGISHFDDATKQEWIPLQAADLIAYATYKCLAQSQIDDWLAHEFETLFKIPHQGILYSDALKISNCLRSLEDAKAQAELNGTVTARTKKVANRRTQARCWAASLGGCSDKISGEHIVTRGTFTEDSVRVKGLSWCADEFKTIGLRSFVKKVLCRHHNSLLSQVDDAAIEFRKTLCSFVDISTERDKLPAQPWPLKSLPVDGSKLERWCLKTLITIAIDGGIPIGDGGAVAGTVPENLVEIAFGLRQFEGSHAGWYWMGSVGEDIRFAEEVEIVTFTNPAGRISGARFRYWGFGMLLLLPNHLQSGALVFNSKDGESIRPSVQHRPGKLGARVHGLPSHELKFHWSLGPNGEGDTA